MSGVKSSPSRHISYDDWQTMLSAEFFQPRQGKPPIVMFVDDEGVGRLCPDCPDALDSLRTAVLAELRQTESSAVLDRVHSRVTSWSKSFRVDAPPVLPLLALTVIAGSQMRNDGTFSAAAYYPRLVELLSPRMQLEDIRVRGLRKHFDDVAEMWKLLHSWILDNQDRLGPSTISTHPFFNRVGYPLSQAVLKTSDRELLADFFEAIHLDNRPMPEAQELLRLLRLWLDRPRGLSMQFRRFVDHGSGELLLMDLLLKLAEAHHGRTHRSGRIRLRLRLTIDLEKWASSWVIPVNDALEADELKLQDGSTLSIAKPAYGSAYEVRQGSFGDAPGLIDRKFRAIGSESVLVKDTQDVWILMVNPTSGKWQSVESMEPGYEHVLMVREIKGATFTELLSQKVMAGYRKLRNQLVPGWDLYADVVLAGNTGRENPRWHDLAHVLEVDVGPAPRLVNGLSLRTNVGGRHYLIGGEPDLLVPSGGATRRVSVVLDGVAQVPPLKANGEPLPLRYFGPMTEGKHSVEVDGTVLDFFVHASGDAALGRVRPIPAPDPVDPMLRKVGPTYAHCRRGKDSSIWFVLPSGWARRHREPQVPPFVEPTGFPYSVGWKVSIPDDAVWVVVERNGQFSLPQYVRNEVGDFGTLDAVSKDFWRRITSATITSADRRWRKCLSNVMEESVRGR